MRKDSEVFGGHRSGPNAGDPVAAIASVLREDEGLLPLDPAPAFAEEVLRSSAVHGVDALLHYRLSADTASECWPGAVRERLRQSANVQAARELAFRRELLRILDRLEDAEVELLLIKGAPLAYLYYPQPYLRTRGDTDIFVPEEKRSLAGDLLLRAGYAAEESRAYSLASYQINYWRRGKAGVEHLIDLHWRISDSQLYSRLFSFEELYDAAVSVPGLGPGVKSPCPVHALAIACMHRTRHRTAPYYVSGVPYLEANRLIWLYDIHLLANRLSRAEWLQFVDLAVAKGLRAVFLDGLRVTQEHLGTGIPAEVMIRLAATGPTELAALYLKPGLWRRYVIDLRALPSWCLRLQLMTEWAFPRVDYMLATYGVRSRWLVPFLYLRRASDQIRRLFRSVQT